jgi:putative ATP-binding cassette transporter
MSLDENNAHVTVDPRNVGLNRLFAKRLWTLVKPYWWRRQGLPSWIALTFTLTIGMTFGIFGAYISSLTAAQADALVGKNVAKYWWFWALIVIFGFCRFASQVAQDFVGNYLNLHWRRWLTSHLIDNYLDQRTYYEIQQSQSLDNPDQRIQEEVAPFCRAVTDVPRQLLNSTVDIGIQVTILASISRGMLCATLIYVVYQIVISYLIYKPTIRQQWESTVAEADLRYGLLHVRDNAETIAFYGGENAERSHLRNRLAVAIKKQTRMLVYSLRISAVSELSGIVWNALPLVFIAPLYFAGTIKYGTILQGTMSAGMIVASFSVLTRFIPNLVTAAPSVVRLAEIQEQFQAMASARSSDQAPRINFRHGASDRISVERLSLDTPGGERSLIRNLSFEVCRDQHLLIVGQTGIGKSSLLRAMAGLWTRGTGLIALPPQSELMFLPQRPYMVLADLRTQIVYPRQQASVLSDDKLQAILERVGLGDLPERMGGFSARRDWSRLLSLGEQQRIAFARILALKPQFAFLDEATSALDHDSERAVYGLLRLSGSTYISVAHRSSVVTFHERMLKLTESGWTIERLGSVPALGGLEMSDDQYRSSLFGI